ncbi:MAG: hypothetical protein ABL921_06300 [Pirellula sp.]
MNCHIATLLLILMSSPMLLGQQRSESPQPDLPQWIWNVQQQNDLAFGQAPNRSASFEKQFEIAHSVRIARLRIAADFCYLNVFINGKAVIAIEPFSETLEITATDYLTIGTNTIRMEARGISGPSAMAATLEIGVGDQPPRILVVTDSSWVCTTTAEPVVKSNSVTLGHVSQSLWGIGRRSIRLDPTENYEQWRQAVVGTKVEDRQFWTPPGFTVTHVKNADPEEGSWVSMAFDSRGRLTIAREAKGLLRMELDEKRSKVISVETIDNELLECRGLLYAHEGLYANANNSKGLFRLHDTDGNDTLDAAERLREFSGGVGHGRNDIALGHDGWIYMIHGDSVELPASEIVDRTSPFRDMAHSRKAGQGHVIRTNRDGSEWELVCAGLRNPFGIAQNQLGDWFTYDADAEFDMGTPWYRPTRVVQLLSGADYGWRSVTGKWPPYFPDHPDNAMPTLDIGKGSPTAVAFAYDSHFPMDYRQALMILDWTYGRVIAVHLFPRGAGYRAKAETFLQGRPLNVTDLAFASDGAMYLITGGRKTQSSLYRVSFAGPAGVEPELSIHEQRCIEHSRSQRAIRQQLESMHANPMGLGVVDLAKDPVAAGSTSSNKRFEDALVWKYLNSPDWQLRHAARIALEHQPIENWLQLAFAEQRTQAAFECCLALIRSNRPELAPRIVERLLLFEPSAIDLSQTMGLVHCYLQLSSSDLEALQGKREAIIQQVQKVFGKLSETNTMNRSGTSQTVQENCLRLLTVLESDTAVELAFGSLLTSTDQIQISGGLYAIRNAGTGWTESRRSDFFRMLNEGSGFVRGEGMEKFLRQIREDAAAKLSSAERESLADVISPPPDKADEVAVPTVTRKPLRQWTAEELANRLANRTETPNRDRGKAIFTEAQCNRCHRMGTRGPAIGPDLTHVANRFSKRDLLVSIVDPSRIVAENYRNAQVLTKDGRTIVGRLLVEGDYRSERISIATDAFSMKGNVEIGKGEIEAFRESAVSPMPAGLMDGFSEQEILDLLEYLSTR